MPIKIPDKLPAKKQLQSENIFVMSENKASHQDIRPLKIVILNLMPKKISTETQLLRLLGNTPLQVEIDLIRTGTYQSKNTPEEHLIAFYKEFSDIKHKKFDGMVITGAPVEHLPFEAVDYWQELCDIMEWSKHNVQSTLHICWGAQAGLYYHYGIPKHDLPKKMFGVFLHKVLKKNVKLLRGFDDSFYAPHSRHTEIRKSSFKKIATLDILSTSKEAGIYIAGSKDGRQIFVTGHSEYDALTLHDEYIRDYEKGLPIEIPVNYYPNNDFTKKPEVAWRSHANLLFNNWLNYYVYQQTPFILEDLNY